MSDRPVSAFLAAIVLSVTTSMPAWGFSRAPNPEVQTVSTPNVTSALVKLHDLALPDLRDITKAAAARNVVPADLFPPSTHKRAQPNRILAIAPQPQAAAFFVGRIASDAPSAAVSWVGYCLSASNTVSQTEIGNIRPGDLGKVAVEICSKSP